MLDLAEIALEALAGPIGGLDHDVKDGGMLHGACGTFRGEPAQGRRSFNYSSPLWGEGAEVACGDLGRRGAEAKAAPLPARLSVPSSPRWGEVTASAPAQTDSFSRRGRAPSPRVRGEGRDEGALPLGSEWQQSPQPRLRRDLSREVLGMVFPRDGS